MAAYTPSMNLSNNTPITKGMVLHQGVRPGIVSSADGVCKVYKESSENETRDGLPSANETSDSIICSRVVKGLQ